MPAPCAAGHLWCQSYIYVLFFLCSKVFINFNELFTLLKTAEAR
jgi:hypothetical protein